jgi:hypothetical protein
LPLRVVKPYELEIEQWLGGAPEVSQLGARGLLLLAPCVHRPKIDELFIGNLG